MIKLNLNFVASETVADILDDPEVNNRTKEFLMSVLVGILEPHYAIEAKNIVLGRSRNKSYLGNRFDVQLTFVKSASTEIYPSRIYQIERFDMPTTFQTLCKNNFIYNPIIKVTARVFDDF